MTFPFGVDRLLDPFPDKLLGNSDVLGSIPVRTGCERVLVRIPVQALAVLGELTLKEYKDSERLGYLDIFGEVYAGVVVNYTSQRLVQSRRQDPDVAVPLTLFLVSPVGMLLPRAYRLVRPDDFDVFKNEGLSLPGIDMFVTPALKVGCLLPINASVLCLEPDEALRVVDYWQGPRGGTSLRLLFGLVR